MHFIPIWEHLTNSKYVEISYSAVVMTNSARMGETEQNGAERSEVDWRRMYVAMSAEFVITSAYMQDYADTTTITRTIPHT